MESFEDSAPQEILRWAVERYGGGLAVAVSFGGPSGYVLLDMLASIEPNTTFYYLDTGLLFDETYAHVARVEAHYGIVATRVPAALSLVGQERSFGAALWERDPDLCCKLRKLEPQASFLKDYRAWVSGIRRDQTASRSHVPIISRDDAFGVVKINPLATWSEAMVWTYIGAHNVPYNALHDRGYRSIGCKTCTVATKLADPARAGRWRGIAKTECGLHV